jgi:hypothetical protein
VLAWQYLKESPGLPAATTVLGCGVIGIGTGLLGGVVMRVWRDSASGLVLQQGGWRYLLVFLTLIAVRVVLRFLASVAHLADDPTVLNEAAIAMAIGNCAGRAINVGLRALALVGWDVNALPSRDEV